MVSSEKISRAVYLSLKEGQKKDKEIIKNLLDFLEKNHLYFLLPNIVKNIQKKIENEIKSRTVFISSPFEMNQITIDNIKNKIGFGSNSHIKTEFKIEKNLLSGVVIRYGYRLFDLSLKRNLEHLKEKLLEK